MPTQITQAHLVEALTTIRTRDLAQALDVTRQQAHQMQAGRVPHSRIGQVLRVLVDAGAITSDHVLEAVEQVLRQVTDLDAATYHRLVTDCER